MTDNTRGQISADNFRLIAVYADKFPPYVKACMNFCSDYRLSVEGEDGALFKVEFLDALPDRFFSLSENNNCVQSVSAIIAQNGCGKTSLARLRKEVGNERNYRYGANQFICCKELRKGMAERSIRKDVQHEKMEAHRGGWDIYDCIRNWIIQLA